MTTTPLNLYGESRIAEAFAAEGRNVPDWIAGEFARHEHDVRRSLASIIERATDLLAKMNGESAIYACRRIADSAGASGPIGSEYAAAIAAAARLSSLVAVAARLAPAPEANA